MNLWLRVAVYYVLTLFFTVLIGGIQEQVGFTTPETLILPQFGPALAAVLMLVAFKKDRFSLTFSLSGISLKRVVLVLLVPVALLCIIFVMYSALIQPIVAHFASPSEIPLVLVGMIAGAFGEEIGWRGYMQRIMSERTSLVKTVVVVGVLWGLWHVGNYQYGVLYVAYFLLFSMGASGIMAHLLGATRYNIVLAAVFHVVLNCGYFVMKEALPDIRFTLLSGCVWVVAWGVYAMLEQRTARGVL